MNAGVAIYGAMVAAILTFMVLEVVRWRRLEGFLTRRQVVLRSINFGVVVILLAILGVLLFDLVPRQMLQLRLALLGAAPLLLLAVLVLVLWDLREIQKRRLAREMEFVGEVARSMIGGRGRNGGDREDSRSP